MMRIGFDAKRLFSNHTGLGNYSRFVVGALAQQFPENQYLLFTPKVRWNEDTGIFNELSNVQVVEPSKLTANLGLKSYWRSVRLGEVARRNEVQVLHGLSNELPKTKPAGLKTVLTVHDLIFKRYPSFYKAVDVKIYDYKLSAALNSADAIIAISKQTAEDITTFYGVHPERIDIVYQGCHPSFFKKAKMSESDAVRVKYNLPGKFLLNVGTLENRKNALVILKALQHLNASVSVVFVGQETPYTRTLKQFVRDNQLVERVHFIHKVVFEELPIIYRQADLLIYPSFFEGFGIPIVEAIASRIPVIAACTSSLPEAGGPSSIYVDPNNELELARAISDLMDNDDRKAKIIEDSGAYIERFRPASVAAEMIKIYSRLI